LELPTISRRIGDRFFPRNPEGIEIIQPSVAAPAATLGERQIKIHQL
jgi:hypothetical protein